jgi:hypothetical protein
MRFKRTAIVYHIPTRNSTQPRGNFKFEVTVKGDARRHIRGALFTIKSRVEYADVEHQAYVNVREDNSLLTSTFYVHACQVTVLQAKAIKEVAEQIFSRLQTPAYFESKGIVV